MIGTCVPIFCIRKKDNIVIVVSVKNGLNLELKSNHLLVRGAHTVPQSTHVENNLSPLIDFTSPITNLLERLILPISGFLGRHLFNFLLVTVTILEIQVSSSKNGQLYTL